METKDTGLQKIDVSKLLARFANISSKQETEYSFYVNEVRKICKQPYIVVHKRFEKAFKDESFDYMLTHTKRWFHEAEKASNPGMIFNARFKKWRELKK